MGKQRWKFLKQNLGIYYWLRVDDGSERIEIHSVPIGRFWRG